VSTPIDTTVGSIDLSDALYTHGEHITVCTTPSTALGKHINTAVYRVILFYRFFFIFFTMLLRFSLLLWLHRCAFDTFNKYYLLIIPLLSFLLYLPSPVRYRLSHLTSSHIPHSQQNSNSD